MQQVIIREVVYGNMGSVIILAGLIIMSVIDIKRKSIHIGMLIIMGIIAVGIRVAESMYGKAEFNIYELLIITGCTLAMSLICAITHMLGAADAVIIGILALAIGIRKAISVFIGAMMVVCIVCGILLILKRLRRKDTIPFIPFILISYMGVTLCG